MNFFDNAIKHPFFVALGAIAITILCIWAYSDLPIQEIPDIQIPYIIVETDYSGAAPEEVESLVTKPLERKISELEDIDSIFSISIRGRSQIVVEFLSGKELDQEVRKIQEQFSNIRDELPNDVSFPGVRGYKLTDRPALIILVSGNYDPYRLGKIAEELRDEIKTIGDCSHVDIFGGLKREIQVQVDPEMLNARMVSILEIINALKQQNLDIPGGIVKDGETGRLVRSIGSFKNVQEIGDTRIRTQYGSIIRVKNVARIDYCLEDTRESFRVNGRKCVALTVYIREKTDLIETVGMVKKKLSQIRHNLPADIQIETVGDMGSMMRTVTRQLRLNAIIGGAFVILVLLIGMELRTSLLISIAIPFSILVAIGMLYVLGISLSGAAIFSIILALGLVVDGAIVVGENIYRHIENGLPGKEAAKLSIREVSGAAFICDLTTIVAFFPLMFMSGPVGQYISVIPKVLVSALAGSMIIDYIVLPTVAARFIRPRRRKLIQREITPLHIKILSKAIKHKKATVFVTFSTFALSFLLIPIIGTELFPKTNTSRIWITVQMPLGSTLERVDSVTRIIEDRLKSISDVEKFACSIGMDGLLDTSFGNIPTRSENMSEFVVEFVEEKKRKIDEIMADLRQKFADIPDARIIIKQRVEGPPAGSDVLIRIKGDDLNVLRNLAHEVAEKLKQIKGAVDVRTDQNSQPQIQVNINREDASSLGLTMEAISVNIDASVNGITATTFKDKDEDINVRVRFPKTARKNIEDIRKINIPAIQSVLSDFSIGGLQSISIPTPSGQLVPLTQIADIREVEGLTHVARHELKRTATVMCNSSGRLVSKLVCDLKTEMAKFNLPQGYYIEYSGESEETFESFKSLGKAMILAVLLVLIILMLQFKSILQPMTIILTVPLSFIGVILGMVVTGNPFGIMAFIGLVSLSGIVVNDAIVLVSYTNTLREGGMEKEAAVMHSARIRFRPIMLTSITTVAGILSITLGIGGGGEFWAPLGWAIIWGLMTATLLTLIVIPVFYLIMEDARERLSKSIKHTNRSSQE